MSASAAPGHGRVVTAPPGRGLRGDQRGRAADAARGLAQRHALRPGSQRTTRRRLQRKYLYNLRIVHLTQLASMVLHLCWLPRALRHMHIHWWVSSTVHYHPHNVKQTGRNSK